VIDERLADHKRDPNSWVPLDQMMAKLRDEGRL